MGEETVRLSPDRLERARAVGRAFAGEHQLAERLAPYEAERWRGEEETLPTLHLDDVSAIPFLVDISGVEEYQHRARLRARSGDLLAAVTPLTPGYEEYCRTILDLGEATFLEAPPADGLLAVACACRADSTFDVLQRETRRHRGLHIHPYMGIEPVWELGRALAAAAGARVGVLGPPPPVTWIANDKALFEDLVAAVLGREWLVESRLETDAPALAQALLELAESHERVALKRLRCASAMGNLVLDGRRLRAGGRSVAIGLVERFLERTEWGGDEAVLAVAWENAALSPSTQLWIPPPAEGPPRLEGVYEQILEGETGVFVGSRPARFDEAIQADLSRAALEVAAGLQAMGYVGRCSFDHLVVGEGDGPRRLRFTECNGRWGGTSTPMSLVDRLFPDGRPPYRAQDFVRPGLVGLSLEEMLRRVGDELFDARSGRGRYLFYNVGPMRRFGKLDVVALGATQEEAESALQEDLPRRLGCL